MVRLGAVPCRGTYRGHLFVPFSGMTQTPLTSNRTLMSHHVSCFMWTIAFEFWQVTASKTFLVARGCTLGEGVSKEGSHCQDFCPNYAHEGDVSMPFFGSFFFSFSQLVLRRPFTHLEMLASNLVFSFFFIVLFSSCTFLSFSSFKLRRIPRNVVLLKCFQ